MNRCIVTYAAGAHEELLDVALPTYKDFAHRHGYDVVIGTNLCDRPAPWNKVPLLLTALDRYADVVWFDCDLVVVNPIDDFPPLRDNSVWHSMVRHFEGNSEVPNSGVWRVTPGMRTLLSQMLQLEVFRDHGWWEQAALMTLMGYTVPPQGSHFPDTKCRNVVRTHWYDKCQFMRLCWNSHPNYRAESPRIVHCSYPDMPRRLEVMRALARNPHYSYPTFTHERYDVSRQKGEPEDAPE